MKPRTQPDARLILTIGILSLFRIVCLEATKMGHLDIVLPLITGLIILILWYYFGR